MQRSKDSNVLPETVKTIVKDTAKYLKIFEKSPEINKDISSYKLDNYKNKTVEQVKNDLNSKNATYIIFGNGDKVINQYPKQNTSINTKQKVFIFTNDKNITMPDLTNYSVKDASIVLDELGIKYEILCTGYVQSQSIGVGTVITSDMTVTLN